MLIRADARALPLVDGCVQCCVTSPPYWALRDYGNPGQIGLEATPDAYVATMVAVFAEVWRVLRDDGTVWLNLGDSYANDGKWGGETGGKHVSALHGQTGIGRQKVMTGLKPKDLVGIPWRVAFALQAAGWYLRADIIWAKPNPMPESVTDRPTKAHEYIFLLSKSARYLYEADAIREESTHVGATWQERKAMGFRGDTKHPTKDAIEAGLKIPSFAVNENGRNKRSVWTVPTQPFSGAHFATFPEALIEPCILAGSRPAGKRCDCETVIETPLGTGATDDPTMATGRAGYNRIRRADEGTRPITRREQRSHAAQMRVSPFREQMAEAAGLAFAHYIRTDSSGARPLPPALLRAWRGKGWLVEPAPCACPIEPADLVLDPFIGSGTVGAVCERFGRRWVGTDLSYQGLSTERTAQRGLRWDEATA